MKRPRRDELGPRLAYIGPIAFDVDIRTRVLQADLTEVEARIGRVLLSDYPRFALLSANKLARAADASTASVSRFVTKLGYADYAAFREQLSREIAAQLESPSARLKVAASSRSSDSARLLADAIEIDIENLRRTQKLVRADNFTRLIDRIAGARGRVYVTGSKKAFSTATYLAEQLAQIRPGVALLRLDDTVSDAILDVGRTDVLVAIEPRRATTALVKVVRRFEAAGATIGLICDEFPAPDLANLDLILSASTRGPSIFDSYTALMTVVNAVLAALIARSPQVVRSRIDQLEAINESFDTWAESSRLR